MRKLEKLTDQELVDVFENGNNYAFDVLLDRHRNRIFSYILRIVKNRDIAEDVFQDVFMKVIMIMKQGRYTHSGKFAAWVTRIAHNQMIDYFRKKNKTKIISNEEYEDVDLFNNACFADDSVEDVLIQNQILGDVSSLVALLPENQKEVVVMRYYKDMSFNEIAETTGVSINTALGRMRYALLNLRKISKEKDVTFFI